MSNLRQAAQQALEALIPLANAGCPNERECLTDQDHERAAEAVEVLEQALAEPEQPHDLLCVCGAEWDIYSDGREELVTAPTTRKPLTEPELHTITPTWPAPGQEWGYTEVLAFARAIERAHGIGEQHE